MSTYASAIHAYNVDAALSSVKNGQILPQYED